MAPACVLAWWRHIGPAGAEPQVVVVRDGEQLIGLAPFYADPRGPRSLRLPCIELGGRLGPLASDGRERDVARAVVETLVHLPLPPEIVRLEAVPVGSDWAAALRETWPGMRRPLVRRYQVSSCPAVTLEADSFDGWLSGRSSKFRAEMRRLRRHFESAGGTTRLSTPETLAADVDVLVRLHLSRWQERGGSKLAALGAGFASSLRAMGEALLPLGDRFSLRVLEIEGQPIGAQLYLPAGGRIQYLAAGWDEDYAKLKPTMLGMLAEVEEGIATGHRRFDLGTGDQHYKLRFADCDDPVVSSLLVPARARSAIALLRIAPLQGRIALQNVLKSRLSEKQVSTLRQGLRRLGV